MDSFIFLSAQRSIICRGIAKVYDSIAEAELALDDPDTLVVGALPFFPHEQPRLFTPCSWEYLASPPALPTTALPGLKAVQSGEDRQSYERRLAAVIARIHNGEFDKLVCSRAVEFHFAAAVDPFVLLDRYLHAAGTGVGYAADLGDAGWLVGPSPEILVALDHDRVRSFPLAGTTARLQDPHADAAAKLQLAASTKDLAEHAFVTQDIAKRLQAVCKDVQIPATPTITATAHTWHLGTEIHAKLHTPTSALTLAARLHPTPAVGGFPRTTALEVLQKDEPDRGFYAGAVGWALGKSAGQWNVAIRSATVRGTTITARVGGGIVADSEPGAEWYETTTKLGPVYAAITGSASQE